MDCALNIKLTVFKVVGKATKTTLNDIVVVILLLLGTNTTEQ